MNPIEYLNDDKILIVSKPLAKALGVGQAILFRRVHYWIGFNQEAAQRRNGKNGDQHFRDGHWWTYNSYPNWASDLEIYSEDTVQRYFLELEELGLLLSSDSYNRLSFDRTKWYTVNYAAYSLFMETWEKCGSPIANGGRITAARRTFLHEWTKIRATLSSPQVAVTMTSSYGDDDRNLPSSDDRNLPPPIPVTSERQQYFVGAEAADDGTPAAGAPKNRLEDIRLGQTENANTSVRNKKKKLADDPALLEEPFVKFFMAKTGQSVLKKEHIKLLTEDIDEKGAPCPIKNGLVGLWRMPAGDEFMPQRIDELLAIFGDAFSPTKILQNLCNVMNGYDPNKKQKPGYFLWRELHPNIGAIFEDASTYDAPQPPDFDPFE